MSREQDPRRKDSDVRLAGFPFLPLKSHQLSFLQSVSYSCIQHILAINTAASNNPVCNKDIRATHSFIVL